MRGGEGEGRRGKGESVVEWLTFLASLYWYPCIRKEKDDRSQPPPQQERERVKELSIYSQFSLASEATRILIILSRFEGEKNDMKQWAVSEISNFLKFRVEGEGEEVNVEMKEEEDEKEEGGDVEMGGDMEEKKRKKKELREKERERGRFLKKEGEKERRRARERAGWLTGLAVTGGVMPG